MNQNKATIANILIKCQMLLNSINNKAFIKWKRSILYTLGAWIHYGWEWYIPLLAGISQKSPVKQPIKLWRRPSGCFQTESGAKKKLGALKNETIWTKCWLFQPLYVILSCLNLLWFEELYLIFNKQHCVVQREIKWNMS